MITPEISKLKESQSKVFSRILAWLRNQIQTIKAISVPLLAIILIVLLKLLCLFVGRTEAPEIDLSEIER